MDFLNKHLRLLIILMIVSVIGVGALYLKEPDRILPPASVNTKPEKEFKDIRRKEVAPKSPEIKELVRLTNLERTRRNIGRLTLVGELVTSAEAKCLDMQVRNYWAHNLEGEAFTKDFIVPTLVVGENLSRGYFTPKAVIDAWMNSEEHRENLLSKDFRDVGFAVCEGPNPHLIVQHLSL